MSDFETNRLSVFSTNSDVKSRGGLRIVDNNKNKRVSDIFNTKKQITYENSKNNIANKQKIIQLSERNIESRLKVIK